MSVLKRKPRTFDVQVHDMTFRITASPDLYEESRAAALHISDQLHAYAARNHEFRTSKHPVQLSEDAPALMRDIADKAALAGVGPMFALDGAVTDYVGRFLAGQQHDVVVASGGDFFVLVRKRTKLRVFRGEEGDEDMSIVVDPKHGPLGVFTTAGRRSFPVERVHGLAVLASSCALADAVGAYTLGLLAMPGPLRTALDYLDGVEGVTGAVVVGDGEIGIAGSVEIAA